MPKPTDTLVFLGPSLSLDQARTLLPQACFLPPLRCGDLLQALRLMPKIILIIDGHFEHCAAVWHKEILFALQQGIQVYGASSMGALRAAELQRFGMQGIGKIFNAYSSGELNDDDEVAVAHLSAQQHYQCLSEAMVDIRATIDSACKQEILSITTANLITDAAKKLFYPERTLTKACQFLLREKNSAPQIENFLTWLAQDQFVSQKALDAKLALETINKITLQAKTIKTSPVICQPSRYFVTLSRMMACQAFFCWQDNLPETEKIILAARLLDEDYLFAKRLARCLAIVYFMPGNTETLLPTDQPLAYEFHEYDHNWQQKNNLSPTEFKNFIERLQHIDKKIRGTF
ncbi:MAG: TfuA-like protein, partial [Pseudomonadota bacterium]